MSNDYSLLVPLENNRVDSGPDPVLSGLGPESDKRSASVFEDWVLWPSTVIFERGVSPCFVLVVLRHKVTPLGAAQFSIVVFFVHSSPYYIYLSAISR